ncbi:MULTISPECIES: hypothetical protein [unclassified Streptomyces]|nr:MULTISPECIES: hypothetical protein [unclassified Streptomyces]WNO70367.1 hypothetical protein RPQ07_01450 [Streptomyces sp. AM8-1-1]
MSLCSSLHLAADTRGHLAATRPWRAPALKSIAFRYAIGWI